jgi:hypothetical protein
MVSQALEETFGDQWLLDSGLYLADNRSPPLPRRDSQSLRRQSVGLGRADAGIRKVACGPFAGVCADYSELAGGAASSHRCYHGASLGVMVADVMPAWAEDALRNLKRPAAPDECFEPRRSTTARHDAKH